MLAFVLADILTSVVQILHLKIKNFTPFGFTLENHKNNQFFFFLSHFQIFNKNEIHKDKNTQAAIRLKLNYHLSNLYAAIIFSMSGDMT